MALDPRSTQIHSRETGLPPRTSKHNSNRTSFLKPNCVNILRSSSHQRFRASRSRTLPTLATSTRSRKARLSILCHPSGLHSLRFPLPTPLGIDELLAHTRQQIRSHQHIALLVRLAQDSQRQDSTMLTIWKISTGSRPVRWITILFRN